MWLLLISLEWPIHTLDFRLVEASNSEFPASPQNVFLTPDLSVSPSTDKQVRAKLKSIVPVDEGHLQSGRRGRVKWTPFC